MKKTNKKQQIVVKRYAPLLPVAVLMYTLLYCACGRGGTYFGVGFWTACLYTFMMRFCDDIADYERDEKNGNAPIKRPRLFCGASVAFLGVTFFGVFWGLWWLFAPCALIALPLVMRKEKIDWIKPLFTPAVVLTIAFSVFEINTFVWIFVGVIGVADGILILLKKK